MKYVTIIGAGSMTKPMVDYFLNSCKYEVTMVNRTPSKAEKILNGRGRVVQWTPNQPDVLDNVVSQSDIVVSMVPKPVHIHVARSCLKNKTDMVTSSFEIPELVALDQKAKDAGIMILNELGEDPGIDHFGTQMLLDNMKNRGASIVSVRSYGSSIPAFGSCNNPFRYKFGWDPKSFTVSAQTNAVYIENGLPIEIPGNRLFENPGQIEIEDLGTFETYPNRDVRRYINPFGIKENASFFRGLLRHPGYCQNMRNIIALDLFNDEKSRDYSNMTYRQFMASLIRTSSTERLESEIADYIGDPDFIEKIEWLGLLDDKQIPLAQGSTLDVVLDTMTKKMCYKPGEKDMIIVYIDVIGEERDGSKIRETATMYAEGEPAIEGESAISKAVALSVAISVKNILGGIRTTGIQIPPTLPELYQPVLEELKDYGLEFTCKRYSE